MQPNYFPIGVFILAATIFWAVGQPEWWPARTGRGILRAPTVEMVKDSTVPEVHPLPASALIFLMEE